MIKWILILSLTVAVTWFSTVEGSNLAFIGLDDQFWQVFIIEDMSNNLVQITRSSIDKVNVSWSDATDKLLVNTNLGEVMIVNTKTSHAHLIVLNMRGMTDTIWSRNGLNVLFSLSIANSIDANDIWLAEVATGKIQKITTMKHMQHDPALSYDEKRVVFVSGAGGQNHDLFVLNLESGATKQLTVGQRYHFEPACSINDEIAFSSNRTGDYEIWVSDFEGKEFEQITHSPGMDGQPTWSPDGKKIAFVSSRGGYPAIWMINRDGSNVHQISPDGMRCRGPVWSR